TGMAVSHFKNAANGGSTLAMANLAQSYINAGFFDEAEEVITKARTAESPHQNVGSAMVALAQQREREAERWTEIKKASHGHLRFLNAFADALTIAAKPDSLIGPWAVSGTMQVTLAITGTAVKASWEDGAGFGLKKRRMFAEIIGSALVGRMQEWNIL